MPGIFIAGNIGNTNVLDAVTGNAVVYPANPERPRISKLSRLPERGLIEMCPACGGEVRIISGAATASPVRATGGWGRSAPARPSLGGFGRRDADLHTDGQADVRSRGRSGETARYEPPKSRLILSKPCAGWQATILCNIK